VGAAFKFFTLWQSYWEKSGRRRWWW
jgi:hypothetical protein